MAKIYKTSEDIVELAESKFEETGLPQIGIDLKVMSVVKQKVPLKVSRANATTEYLTSSNDVVCLYVYEEVFDRLSDEFKVKLMEGALSNISFDSEREKLNVDTNPVTEIVRMRRKYNNYLDAVEASLIVIEEVAEEEKMRKQAEREAKKNKEKKK